MNSQTISVGRDIKSEMKAQAAQLRSRFTEQRTLVINIVSSPGAGKTSLLEATARHWCGRFRIAALVGDIETERDAERLSPWMPVRQLTTGGACHLELPLVRRGIEQLKVDNLDFLFVENVGNLVCPSSHDLAEHLRVVLLSTTEGDDKPGKYPGMFRSSHAMILSKTDLLPYVPFSPERAAIDALRIQPDLSILSVCALSGSGVPAWCNYLVQERDKLFST